MPGSDAARLLAFLGRHHLRNQSAARAGCRQLRASEGRGSISRRRRPAATKPLSWLHVVVPRERRPVTPQRAAACRSRSRTRQLQAVTRQRPTSYGDCLAAEWPWQQRGLCEALEMTVLDDMLTRVRRLLPIATQRSVHRVMRTHAGWTFLSTPCRPPCPPPPPRPPRQTTPILLPCLLWVHSQLTWTRLQCRARNLEIWTPAHRCLRLHAAPRAALPTGPRMTCLSVPSDPLLLTTTSVMVMMETLCCYWIVRPQLHRRDDQPQSSERQPNLRSRCLPRRQWPTRPR